MGTRRRYLLNARKRPGRALRAIVPGWNEAIEWTFWLTLRGWDVIYRKI